jgi:shikimate dehydrogenase
MASPHDFGIAGLLGWPVAHSRSPIIHNYWLQRYGIRGQYVLFPVAPERLDAALHGLSALSLRGCNVTTPHKQAVMPVIEHVDPLARRIGAVNTIVVGKDGALTGFNNDGNGFVQSLRDAKPGWRPDSGPAVVIGAGGAARAVLASLADQGAREIRLVNRTFERARALADEYGPPVRPYRWEERAEILAGAALLANATDRGMAGKPALELDLAKLPTSAIVGDLIYTPPETPLLEAARVRGNLTVNGLGLLLNQARPAFNAWFGVMPEITPELVQAIEATF